jgi:hypothetical protein
VYPLKDAPYTAAYEEQEVFSGIHTFLKEADGMDEILPSAKLLLAECVKYVINRVSYYYPPRLPKEVLAEKEKVKTGELDPNLWIAVEDLQDGWNKSGQVGQEVYGAGIAFGIVPRQYYKIKEAGFMIFVEYPSMNFKIKQNTLTFFTRGDERLSFRMSVVPMNDKEIPEITVITGKGSNAAEVTQEKGGRKDYAEYMLNGNSDIKIEWS